MRSQPPNNTSRTCSGAQRRNKESGQAITVESWIKKAIAVNESGRFAEAVECYDRSLQITPRDVTIWRNKGNAPGNLKRSQDALGCFEQVQKLGDPTAEKFVEQCRRMLKTSGI